MPAANLTKLVSEPFIGWAGCACGLTGSFLLALHFNYSEFGWIFFLLSNVFCITQGIMLRKKSIVVMQAGFTLITLLGVTNWLLKS